MKYISILFTFLALPTIIFASESIKSFNVDIDVDLEKNKAIITESIEYDFGSNNRHGIFREIPKGFKPAGSYIGNSIKFIDVTNNKGEGLTWKKENTRRMAKIRIGDADKTITGIHTYVIKYEVDRVIGFFENNDEFYWNVTGTEWEVPIESFNVRVNFSPKVGKVDVYTYCGKYGTNIGCLDSYMTPHDNGVTIFSREMNLAPKEGVTIDIEFDKGFAINDHKKSILDNYLLINTLLFFIAPIITLLFFTRRISRWLRYRKYIKKNPLKPQYDAGDFSLLEASYIEDPRFETGDSSALIVWFAIKRLIKIHHEMEGKKNIYSFELLVDVENDDNPIIKRLTHKEIGFLDELDNMSSSGRTHEIKPFDYKNGETPEKVKRVWKIFNMMLLGVRKSLKDKGYLNKNGYSPFGVSNTPMISAPPVQKVNIFVRMIMIPIVLIMFVLTPLIILSGPVVLIWSLSRYLAVGIFLAIVMIISLNNKIPLLPNYTEKGLAAHRYIQGLRWYIDQAEDFRMNELNKIVKTPELYEKLLPFAMIFGLEDKWTHAFDGILEVGPEWYESSNNFSTTNFSHGLIGIGNSLNSSTKMPQSSSGGGFSGGGGSSGGGGGGGGGGSW